MRRIILGLVLMLSVASSAQAVTIRDIIDLTKAGLGDEVLLALIEVDGGVFDIDAGTLSSLKSAGVSEPVIVALVRSGRVGPPASTPDEIATAPVELPAPQIVVVEAPPTTIVHEVQVPVPVYVAVPVVGRHRQARQPAAPVDERLLPLTSPQANRPYLTDIPPQPQKQPVYWGWGGKLRPDAWQPK